ncbi:MAG: hypothetical protein AAB654_25835 [Acidobacteriota bacterium]
MKRLLILITSTLALAAGKIEVTADKLQDHIRGGLLGHILGDLNGPKHENKYFEALLAMPLEGGRHTISLGLIAEAEQALAPCDCWNPADPMQTQC